MLTHFSIWLDPGKHIVAGDSGDYEIELLKWNGTVAEVLVNGKSKGVIQSQPYSKKIALEAGKNEVSVLRVCFGVSVGETPKRYRIHY